MEIGGVFASVLLSTSLCLGFFQVEIDSECRIVKTEKSEPTESVTESAAVPESSVEMKFKEPEPPVTESTELVATVLASLELGDRATFEKHVTSDFGRETVWKILSRPNRTIKDSQIVAQDDSSLSLVLDIEDDEAVKRRTFELKTAKVGEDWVVSDWVYVRE